MARAVLQAAAWTLAGLLAAFLILGAVLNASWFPPVLTRAVYGLTGWVVETDRIRFRYPLDLRLEGFAGQGIAGKAEFQVRAQAVEVRASLDALTRGAVDEVRVVDPSVALRFFREREEGAPPSEGRLVFPSWLLRVRSADIRDASFEVGARNALLSFSGMGFTWYADREGRAGTLSASLRPGAGRQGALTLRIEEDRVVAGGDPVLLPDLDLESLAAFAGQGTPSVSGNATGTLRLLPAQQGIEGLELDLRAAGLSVGASGASPGFHGEDLVLRLRALFPLSLGERYPPVEAIRLTAEAAGTVHGIRSEDARLPQALEPFRFRVLAEIDPGAGTAEWDGEASAGHGLVAARLQGKAEGLLSAGPVGFEAFFAFLCRDLPGALALQAPRASLPAGFDWAGGAEATVRVRGTSESMDVSGKIAAKDLSVRNPEGRVLPVRVALGLKGRAGRSGVREMVAQANGARLGDLVSVDARLHYEPERVGWTFETRPMDLRGAGAFLDPVLPEHVRGFDWSGDLVVSSRGSFTAGAGGGAKADARLRWSGGSFASSDYQRMGEGIGVEIAATASLGTRDRAVALRADAQVSGGEIVHDGLYLNLNALRPVLQLDLEAGRAPGRVKLNRSTLDLTGIGTVRLRGTFGWPQGGTDNEWAATVEGVDLDLAGVSRVLGEGGFGERWPFLHTATASGSLGFCVAYHQRGSESPSVRGRLLLDGGSFAREQSGLSAADVRVDLPFSLGDAQALGWPTDKVGSGETGEGLVSAGRVDYRGILVPGVTARLRIQADRLSLLEPLQAELAGGRIDVPELFLSGLTQGKRQGRVSLRVCGADLGALARGLLGTEAEGRVSLWIPGAGLEGERLYVDSGLVRIQSGRGRVQVEGIALEASPREGLEGRFNFLADGFPLEAFTDGGLQGPALGKLDGRLSPVSITGGRLRAAGELTVSAWQGTIRISRVRGAGIPGPDPTLEADVRVRDLHLAEMFSPGSFGRVSGVLQGEILDLRVGGRFPYVDAFRLNLETVKVRGVPQKIGARAVENLSRVGGSGVLSTALSSGLLSLFEEYYYGKIGVRAQLEQGWLELHGIPGRGGREYLILRACRLPTLSMPLKVQSEDRRIRFGAWVSYLRGFGGGDD